MIGENLDRQSAIAAFRAWLLDPHRTEGPSLAEIRCALRNRDLACWCPLHMPCHADVLLEFANRHETRHGAGPGKAFGGLEVVQMAGSPTGAISLASR
jgi:hypothetical protein